MWTEQLSRSQSINQQLSIRCTSLLKISSYPFVSEVMECHAWSRWPLLINCLIKEPMNILAHMRDFAGTLNTIIIMCSWPQGGTLTMQYASVLVRRWSRRVGLLKIFSWELLLPCSLTCLKSCLLQRYFGCALPYIWGDIAAPQPGKGKNTKYGTPLWNERKSPQRGQYTVLCAAESCFWGPNPKPTVVHGGVPVPSMGSGLKTTLGL